MPRRYGSGTPSGRRISASHSLGMPIPGPLPPPYPARVNDDFTLTDLRAFVASVRTGSISQAATVLAASQPTISQRLQRLERTAGHRLLVRSRRGVHPTGAGERLLGYAERILAM